MEPSDVKMYPGLFTENDVKNDKNSKIIENYEEPLNIANLEQITDNILDLLDFMHSEEMIIKKHQDNIEFERILSVKYNDLMPRKIIDLLLEDEKNNNTNNFNKLIKMIEVLSQIKGGNLDYDQEYTKFTEDVNEEYIYSKYGGKENFQKVLAEDQKKQNKKTLKKARRDAKKANL
jgi:hypothetical protein